MDARQAVKQAVQKLRLVESQEDEEARLVEAGKDDEPGELGEFQVAEYVIFLLAFDTYTRYVEERTGEEDPRFDQVIQRGLTLLRKLDTEVAQVKGFLDENVPTATHKKMLDRAFRLRATSVKGAGRRALGLRTVLNRGGPQTMRAVFETNKNLRRIREGMAAAMLEDASDALKVFAGFPIRNQRIRYWIRMAAKTAGLGFLPKSAVEAASEEAATDQKDAILREGLEKLSASTADAIKGATEKKAERLVQVEEDAREAAKATMELSGEEDRPLTRSEVVGVATAAAVAAATDPSDSQNIPSPLRKLDDEQRVAALTDGRVLVAAGAGAGKSTTLVARIGYLVNERRVLPSRILATSFNTKAASELKERIGKTIGGDALQQMSVGTMHSLFRRFIGEYGTGEEKTALGLGGGQNGFIQTGSSVARTVQRMWAECFNTDERPTPRLKNMLKYKSQWSGNNITPAEARAAAKNDEERDAADWYELYEGLKGAIPGWEPPCEEKAREVVEEEYEEKLQAWRRRGGRGSPPKKRGTTFETFMSRYRPGDIRLGDFDDMLTIFRDVLKREPAVRKALQKMYDHIMVDECVHADTEVVTSEGPMKVGDLYERTTIKPCIQSYENGEVCFKPIIGMVQSSKTRGVTVRMASGRELCMTHNHRVYASELGEVPEGQLALYLMYRRGMGFRIGVSSNPTQRHGSNGTRANAERADALWVLEVGEASEVLFKEQALSLRHKVPTYLFEGEVRGCDQERINRIFAEFGDNGAELLEAYDLHFDYPHWTNKTYTGGDHQRHVLTVRAHRSGVGKAGTSIGTSWTGESGLEKYGNVYEVRGGRKMLNKRLANYVELRDFALKIANAEGLRVVENMTVGSVTCTLTTAGALFEGMALPVLEDGQVVMDEIVEITPIEQAVFYDLAIQDTANFFGNGVLSHNCQDLNQVQHDIITMMSEHITDGEDGKSLWMVGDDKQSIYHFRGARPDLFTDLHEKEGWNTRMIKTNYRCEPEIVEHANKLIAHNEGQIPMEARPNPGRPRGMGSIRVENPMDEAEAALRVVEEIKGNLEVPGAEISENAVLCRTNKELHAYETACIVRGIPYARKGASSFLGSPETSAVLGYVQLALGDDYEKMQKALKAVVNKPNRFFVGPDAGSRAVEDALSQYARRVNQSVKDVNPLAALRDPDFVDILAEKLAKTTRGFKFDKTVEKLDELARSIGEMQANAEQPGYSTTDLFEEILSLRGTASAVDPDTGRTVWIEQSFRESLQADLRDATGDDDEVDEDDDEEDQTKGLGNVGFLFKLAEVDPTDPLDLENDPSTPNGFKAKMERLAARARDLRIDISKWDKAQQALPPDQRRKPPGVFLGTVHATKGAQWDHTYVQMPKGKFPFEPPQKPGAPPPDPEEMKEQLEGERRLAYVALTRAAKTLNVICPNVVGGKRAGVSQFVDEAGLTLGENTPKVGTEEAAEAEAEAVTTKEAAKRRILLGSEDYQGPLPEGWDVDDDVAPWTPEEN